MLNRLMRQNIMRINVLANIAIDAAEKKFARFYVGLLKVMKL